MCVYLYIIRVWLPVNQLIPSVRSIRVEIGGNVDAACKSHGKTKWCGLHGSQPKIGHHTRY